MKARAHHLIIVCAFALSVVLYRWIPGPFLTGPFLRFGSWTLAPRPLIASVLPMTALVTHIALSRVWMRERNLAADDETVAATSRSISLCVVTFIALLHASLLAGLSGALWLRPWIGRAVVVLFGLLMIALGNLLPRTRPNLAFGIRTARTLDDRRLWMQINRFGGYVAVTWGLVIALAGAFLTKPLMPLLVTAAGLVGLVALLRSYRKYARG